jgi:hypothetical protein
MPSFVNDLNFTNMSTAMMKGWTQAYFTFHAFQNLIPLSQVDDIILRGIRFVATLKGQSNDCI